jgi:putative endonuclease
VKRLEVGRRGEQLARSLLKKRGYRIVESNARGRYGEIDIVARVKGCLVFVEVRSRTSTEFGTPEESVTRKKRQKLITCALDYVTSHDNPENQVWRIDVVAIEMDEHGIQTRAEVIENAVPIS